jgi:hypothetical protein
MDWNLAIEKNREALKRILAMLVAMAAASGAANLQTDARPATLPRHLHRFVLRLLRPAESAVRRLIIVAARGLVVKLPPPRVRKPKAIRNRSNGFGTGVVIRPGPLPEWARALAPKRSTALALPLLDPLKRFGPRRRRTIPEARMPRIASLGGGVFNPLFQRPRQPDTAPLPPSPDDPLDAGRLHRRLQAMASALDDLPRQAKRLARWQARRDAALQREQAGEVGAQDGNTLAQRTRRLQRLEPMRPGRPPGWRRKPGHRVDEVLNDLHGLAVWVRDHPDTS